MIDWCSSTRVYFSLLSGFKRQRRFGRLSGVVALVLAARGASFASASFGQSNLTWGSTIEVPGTASANAGDDALRVCDFVHRDG